MSAFFDYLRNITYYLLFASLVGLIAPTGKYRKYINWVMGLVLLVLMLQPIMSIVGGQIPVTQWFEGMFAYEQTDNGSYEHWREAHLSAAFEEQLHAQVERLLLSENIYLHNASFSYSDDFSRITFIRLIVSRQEENQRVPFIRIEPVQINRNESLEDPLIEKVKNMIAVFYNLNQTHIHVEIFTNEP